MSAYCFLSADLNGTLVHANAMQVIIQEGFSGEPWRYETASQAFSLQTSGKLSMEETFRIAGEQTRNLPLKVAVDYALNRMSFVDGYSEFVAFLKEQQIPTPIVSTAYSVTLCVLHHGIQAPNFIPRCNR